MAVDLQQWRKGIPYDVRATVGDIMADLQTLETLPAVLAEESKRIWRPLRWIAIGLVVALVLSAILAPILIVPLIVFGIIGVIGYVIWGAVKTSQKPHNLYRAAALNSLLKAVGHDMNQTLKVHARLLLIDGSTPVKESAFTRRKSGKEKLFRDEWLQLEGEFLDGVEYSFGIVQLMRMRTWRNPRGKSKSKSRAQHLCTLRLRYPADRYGSEPIPEPMIKRAIRLPSATTCKAFRATPKALLLKTLVRQEQDLKPVGRMMFLSLYKVLNGLRRHKIQGAKG
jgi:hypothetical protein